MNKNSYIAFLLFIFTIFYFCPLEAEWIYTPKDGKWTNPKYESKNTPRDQFQYAQSFEKKKRYDRAAREYKKIAKSFPTSNLVPDALFRASECYEDEGKFYKAFITYQELIEKSPAYKDFNDIVDRQFRIGNLFLSGRRRKLWKIAILPSSEQGIEIFRKVIENLPFSDQAIQAQFNIGLIYEKINKFKEASQEYEKVIANYPKTEQAIRALYRIGLCSFNQSRGPDHDPSSASEALKSFREFIQKNPDSDLVADARQKVVILQEREAEGTYNIGLYYEKAKDYAAAEVYYKDVIQNYSETKYAEQAAERLKTVQKKIQTDNKKED